MAVMPAIGRNRRGTGSALRALQASEQLGKVDEGLVAMARATAELFDDAIRSGAKHYAIAAIGRLHLATLLAVMGRMPEQPPDEDLGELLRILTETPSGPMGDAPLGG
jgi:hypothetical protein